MNEQEIFAVAGVSHDVGYARAAAFQALQQTLGPLENVSQWRFAGAEYQPATVPDEKGEAQPACQFTIRYVRVPEEVEA